MTRGYTPTYPLSEIFISEEDTHCIVEMCWSSIMHILVARSTSSNRSGSVMTWKSLLTCTIRESTITAYLFIRNCWRNLTSIVPVDFSQSQMRNVVEISITITPKRFSSAKRRRRQRLEWQPAQWIGGKTCPVVDNHQLTVFALKMIQILAIIM